MANISGFNANEQEEVNFDPVPEADYLLAAIESELKPTNGKNGAGSQLVYTFVVTEGPFKDRKLFARFNWENPSETAVKIGRGQFAAFCKAVNNVTPKNSEELHNIPVVCHVKVEPRDDKPGSYSNVITSFKPRSEWKPGGSAPPSNSTGGAPSQQQAPWKK